MADEEDLATLTDPQVAISQGKRHLMVLDYNSAVETLGRGCQMLADKFGDIADELGEPYILYGRALLGLAREEATVFGVPGTEGGDGDCAEEEGDAEEEDDKGDEEDAEKKETDEDKSEEKSDDKTEEKEVKEAEVDEAEVKESEVKEAEVKESKEVKEEKEEKSADDKSEKKDGDKMEESDAAGSSKEVNGEAAASSSAEQNGDHENGVDDVEDECDEESEVTTNLQLGWEVLELAKLILGKRDEAGWKQLAETHRLLGEIAMESGNSRDALIDLNACLELMQKIKPYNARSITEIHYLLGWAHSLANEFDQSMKQFNEAIAVLEKRVKELEAMTEPPETEVPFYTVEGEIKELKSISREIKLKMADLNEYKQEAYRVLLDGLEKSDGAGSSNGAGPSGSGAGSSSSGAGPSSSSSTAAATEATAATTVEESSSKVAAKPASDISHLVRKKRKAEECEVEASPNKKPAPEKA